MVADNAYIGHCQGDDILFSFHTVSGVFTETFMDFERAKAAVHEFLTDSMVQA